MHKSFDPASVAILDRLQYLIGLVESGSSSTREEEQTDLHDHQGIDDMQQDESSTATQPLPEFVGISAPVGNNHSTTPITGDSSQSDHLRSTVGPSQPNGESLTVPYIIYGSSEDILGWSVFQSQHDRAQIEKLIYDPTIYNDTESTAQTPTAGDMAVPPNHVDREPRITVTTGRGIREEDIMTLIERFLSYVHIKNPIFDADVLRNIAKLVAERGFGWDIYTCLVVSLSIHLIDCRDTCNDFRLATGMCLWSDILSFQSRPHYWGAYRAID